MDQSFGITLNTLRKAHYVLRQETESLAQYGPIEAEALRRLRDTARSLQEQAHSLLVAMAYQQVPETLQDEAEDLVRAFVETAHHLETTLARDTRGN